MNKHTSIKEYHIGIVVDNADPEQRGRIKVRCDSLMGLDVSLPDFIDPVFPYIGGDGLKGTAGWFFVPDIGVKVEIEITSSAHHDETFGSATVDSPDIKWRACVVAPGTDSINSDFLGDNYPSRRGIITNAGHGILFDDTSGDPEVKIFQVNDFGTSFLNFDEVGSATLLTSKGMLLYMNQDAGEISLIDTNQNALVMNPTGWFITDANSNMISTADTVFQFLAKEAFLFNGTLANFNVSNVQIGSNPSLWSPVVVEGVAIPFTTALSTLISEIVTSFAAATPPLVPLASAAAFIAALNAGAHTADSLETM